MPRHCHRCGGEYFGNKLCSGNCRTMSGVASVEVESYELLRTSEFEGVTEQERGERRMVRMHPPRDQHPEHPARATLLSTIPMHPPHPAHSTLMSTIEAQEQALKTQGELIQLRAVQLTKSRQEVVQLKDELLNLQNEVLDLRLELAALRRDRERELAALQDEPPLRKREQAVQTLQQHEPEDDAEEDDAHERPDDPHERGHGAP